VVAKQRRQQRKWVKLVWRAQRLLEEKSRERRLQPSVEQKQLPEEPPLAQEFWVVQCYPSQRRGQQALV
jgi:hypothetical protein